jgi:hypothetical protein
MFIKKAASFLFILGLFSSNIYALTYPQQAPIYAEFINGINADNTKACAAKTQNLCSEIIANENTDASTGNVTPDSDTNTEVNINTETNTEQNNIDEKEKKIKQMHDYAVCMISQMQNEPVCSQNLALLNMLKPDFVEITNIESYQFFDAVETKINKDEQQKWYFIVDKRGEFIDTKKIYCEIKDSTVYPYFIRKYPNTIHGSVQSSSFPPRYETLPVREMRLVFSSSLLDGSNANTKIGYMECGYDFYANGSFKWAKFLKIVPNNTSLKL